MMATLKKNYKNFIFRTLTAFLFFCLQATDLHAQTIIKGEIDISLKVDSFTFTYTTDFVEHDNIFNRGHEMSVGVNNGRFEIQLSESPDVFYVKFNLPKNRSDSIDDGYRVLGNNANIFMVKPNLIVEISIKPQKIMFSGAQKTLMECQLELFNRYSKMMKERIALGASQGQFENTVNREKVWAYLNRYKSVHDSAMHEAKDIVSRYALDSLTGNSVYFNFLGTVRFFEINYLNLRTAYSKNALRSHFIAYYNEFYSDQKMPDESAYYLGASNMYPRYLAYKVRTDIAMRLAPLGSRIKPNLILVDKLIAERYRGYLYDQVAISSLLSRGKEYMEDILFTTVIGNIQNREYIQYVEKIRDRRSSGTKAFQFVLEDESGSIYRNTDFKGKVILLDFWFTGCRGCIALHKNMKPVKEHFKDNPNFIYVSISIDRNKKIWKESLASGVYTDETDVKLWLTELGDKHPIIRHYDISSYPTMIVIDGNDEVAAMNPPNPYSEHNKNALINIIEHALNK